MEITLSSTLTYDHENVYHQVRHISFRYGCNFLLQPYSKTKR